jgi:sortase B
MSEKKPGASGRKNIILNVIIGVCVAAIVLCACQITYSLVEYKKAKDKNEEITGTMQSIFDQTAAVTPTEQVTTEPAATTETSASETEETTVTETTEPAPVPREQYREIYEQLSTLKAQYSDLMGWIRIEFDEKHTINLPVMKGEDNNYYISHAYDGTESKAGAIFADYRNTDRRLDLNQNLILYGHHMNDGSMFAYVATKYKTRAIFDEVDIVFYSMDGVYTFNVFSVYNATAGDDYDRIGFAGDSLKEYCVAKQKKSFYSKKLTFDEVDTIVTLVTCTNFGSDGRVIVHGVLDSYDPFFD